MIPAPQLVIESSLRQPGHNGVLAGDGASVRHRLQADSQVRVVVSDWLMRGINGRELWARVRTRGARRAV